MIGQQTTGGGEILDKLAGNGYTYFLIIITKYINNIISLLHSWSQWLHIFRNNHNKVT